MEYNPTLFWDDFRIWVYGGLICFLAAPALAYLAAYIFRDSATQWIVPFTIAILFFPLILMSRHGLKHGYAISGRWNHIYRGTAAFRWNIFAIILYLILVFVAWIYRDDWR